MSVLAMFFEGMILGFGAAVPLGPINLLIMNEALKSYKKAVAIGFGAMSADVTYLLLILYGITIYLKEAIFLSILSTLGGFFLIYLAYLIFRGRDSHIQKVKVSKKTTALSNYFKGYILTLLNPYTILFWLSVTTYSTTTQSFGITIFGMVFAITLWVAIMPYFVYVKRTLISDRLSSIIAIISSIIILIFGLLLLVKTFSY